MSELMGYRLLHEGTLALSRVEDNGIRVDVDYLRDAIDKVNDEISVIQAELKETEVWAAWRKRFGGDSNLTSRDQLREVLFNVLKFPVPAYTETGRPAADESALDGINDPFVKEYSRMMKLDKAQGTYLTAILRESQDGFLHPSFNLNTTQTFRSSSSGPNFQNMPIRNKLIGGLIRNAFMPSVGNHLVEVDYSGIEVKIAYCYHKDPNMQKYLLDPTKDMHRDTFAECFLLDINDVNAHKDHYKEGRNVAKNKFVFPQFYGDYYINCAQNMWEDAQRYNLTTVDGTPLIEHLKTKGITRLGRLDPKREPGAGTFEAHMRSVERDFWGRRFPVYTGWKRSFYQSYQKKGYFDTLTGFRLNGYYNRKEVINYPVQGSAFHCLLWSLINLQNWMRRRGMFAKIVGQIHDSIVADVPPDELQDFLSMAKQVMTVELPKVWDWIITPLETEADVSPVDASWHKKQPWVEVNGLWVPKNNK